MSAITLSMGFICKDCGKASHRVLSGAEFAKLKSFGDLTCKDCDAKAS